MELPDAGRDTVLLYGRVKLEDQAFDL